MSCPHSRCCPPVIAGPLGTLSLTPLVGSVTPLTRGPALSLARPTGLGAFQVWPREMTAPPVTTARCPPPGLRAGERHGQPQGLSSLEAWPGADQLWPRASCHRNTTAWSRQVLEGPELRPRVPAVGSPAFQPATWNPAAPGRRVQGGPQPELTSGWGRDTAAQQDVPTVWLGLSGPPEHADSAPRALVPGVTQEPQPRLPSLSAAAACREALPTSGTGQQASTLPSCDQPLMRTVTPSCKEKAKVRKDTEVRATWRQVCPAAWESQARPWAGLFESVLVPHLWPPLS